MQSNLHDSRGLAVALRKESVDRNDVIRPAIDVFLASLSARRAWIEMTTQGCCASITESLSARRAWIEMFFSRSPFAMSRVALRKESVDRNIIGNCLSNYL